MNHDPDRPNVALMYDYLLGGDQSRPADRRAVDQVMAVLPELPHAAWANRAFHQRAAIWMTRHGISQFIDIGCGLPTRDNTHQVVRRAIPAARVAYVDNDPDVIIHAQKLLADDTSQVTVVHGDVRDPEAILTNPDLLGLINLNMPCGLLITAVMHFISDADDPWQLVGRLCSVLAPRSYLALSHATVDALPPLAVAAGIDAYQDATGQLYPRTREEVERFFTGLEIVPPYEGAKAEVCRIGLWGCLDPASAGDDSSQALWCAVARQTS